MLFCKAWGLHLTEYFTDAILVAMERESPWLAGGYGGVREGPRSTPPPHPCEGPLRNALGPR